MNAQELEDLEVYGQTWVEQAAALTISSQDELDFASGCLADLRTLLERAEAFVSPVVESARASVKAAEQTRTEAFKLRDRIRGPFERAIATIKGGMERFLVEQQREARRIQAEHDDQVRRAREVQAQQDAAQREVAAAAERAGAPAPAPPPPVPVPAAPVVPAVVVRGGAQARTVYSAKVVDLPALVAACATGAAPLELLQVDQRKLDKLAAAFDESPWPGVVFEKVDQVVHAPRERRR